MAPVNESVSGDDPTSERSDPGRGREPTPLGKWVRLVLYAAALVVTIYLWTHPEAWRPEAPKPAPPAEGKPPPAAQAPGAERPEAPGKSVQAEIRALQPSAPTETTPPAEGTPPSKDGSPPKEASEAGPPPPDAQASK